MVRVRADRGQLRVGDVLEGVGAARVLGDGDVVIVYGARDVVDNDVLDDGAEADGAIDLGLALLTQADALGVAASLDCMRSDTPSGW